MNKVNRPSDASNQVSRHAISVSTLARWNDWVLKKQNKRKSAKRIGGGVDLVARHEADAVAGDVVPQPQAAIARSGRQVIGVGMKLDHLSTF